MDEKKALYLLWCSEELWSRTINEMARLAGSYAEALSISETEYEKRGIFKNSRKTEGFLRVKAEKARLMEAYERLTEQGINVIAHWEAGYPERLRAIEDAPLIIFTRGRLPDDNIPSAAVIGARECSEYGASAAAFFAGELAKHGVQIVSGMAYGIDYAAGKAALECGGESFAVLGTGVDVCYPGSSRDIYDEMSAGRGGVISEFAAGSQALPHHFVIRNRLISAFGDVLLVIEAREKSGTSLTVGYALDQGKDVFAMPGRITDPLGRGCNKLIKDGAMVLTEPSDVLSCFNIECGGRAVMGRTPKNLDGTERKVYGGLSYDSRHVEEIAERAGITLNEALHVLTGLERRGIAISTGNAYYRKAK